jgi:hypothetical protein
MYVYHNFFGAYWAYLSKFPTLIPGMRPGHASQAASRGGNSPPLGCRNPPRPGPVVKRPGLFWHAPNWLVVLNMVFIFPYIGNNHPNWRHHIFQRGWNHQPAKNAKKWEFWKYLWNNMKHHRTKTIWKHFKRHLFGERYIYFTRSMGHDLTRMTATNAAWEDAKVWPIRHRKGPKSQLWHCLLVLSPTDLRWFTSEWYSMVRLLQSDCMILWWLKSNLVS